MPDDGHPQHADINAEMWVKIDEIISANTDIPGAIITVLRECQDVVGSFRLSLLIISAMVSIFPAVKFLGLHRFMRFFPWNPRAAI